MRILPTVLVCTTGALSAQSDLIYYKFDSAAGGRPVNYAADTDPGTALGMGPSYGARGLASGGAFGSPGSLAASINGMAGNTVDTGFKGGIRGSLTIALAMRNRTSNSPLIQNGLLGRPDFDFSSGDRTGNSLILRGWGGADLTFAPKLPICSMPGWNHFALVVDGPGKQARWYVNGVLAQTTSIAQTVAISPSTTGLVLGRDWQSHCGAYYELDEMRVYARAAAAGEIAGWSKGTTPATAVFGADVNRNADVGLAAAGGTPHYGNSGFGLRVTGAPAGVFGLAIGLGRLAAPLATGPLFGAEGFLHIGTDLVVVGRLDNGGAVRLHLPIPAGQGIVEVYSQAVVADRRERLAMTPALAHSVARQVQ